MNINGVAIKDYRLYHNISQEEMAGILGIAQADLTSYENGFPWYEEDPFRLYILNTLFDDLSYLMEISLDEILEQELIEDENEEEYY